MTRWVALLRGVNVGGVTVRSAELVELFASEGFTQVVTVLASGNVVFDADAESEAVKAQAEVALSQRFNYDAKAVVVSQRDCADRVAGYPFLLESERQPYVIFGSDEAILDELFAAACTLESTEDQISRGTGVIYWSLPKGRSTVTPVAKLLAKVRYRASTTVRNLRTVEKVAIA